VTKPSAKLETLSVTASVLAKLAADESVSQELTGGGRLRFDHRLPFICVYRRRGAAHDDEMEKLLAGEPASLVVPVEPKPAANALKLLRAIVENLAAHFGSFLILEIWATEDKPRKKPAATDSNGQPQAHVKFEIAVRSGSVPRFTVEALAKSLQKTRLARCKSRLAITPSKSPCPADLKPLVPHSNLEEWNGRTVGLAIRVTPDIAETDRDLEGVLRRLRRSVSAALRKAFFAFVGRQTNIRPVHYYALGKRSIVKAVFDVDRQLAAIGRSFDLLLQATPVNAEDAWHEFSRDKFTKPPVFYYRPLALDPLLLKRKLYAIPVERVDDPTLSYLFRQKQDELDRQITLLTDVGSSRFLPESLQIYGGVSDWLMNHAQELLDSTESSSREESVRNQLSASEIAEHAAKEIAYYRLQNSNFTASAVVRDDLFSGMMVSADQLLIGVRTRLPKSRIDAMMQHEIGTHIVTRFNGRQQPFKQLEVGLAGYDGLQEGLAVLAEYLVGGLSRLRLRVLAARVVAARQMLDGATFIDTFRTLDRDCQFSRRSAYTIAMRIYRGGGLTKDAVYLRGLLQILKYLGDGGDLEPLYLGKMAATHLPFIAELRLRQILKPPVLRPRYLELPAAQEKITRLRNGLTILQLIAPTE
jgi:uncharacterized protein (TIGR02421 family)